MRALGQYGKRYPVRIIDYGERPFDTEDAKENDPFRWWQDPREHDGGPYPGPYIPDPEDPATIGCLLGLVREAYADPKASCFFSRMIGAWVVNVRGVDDPIESYVSEWDALANTLLAAP